MEDRGDFSGDSVHSFTFLWCSLNFLCIFFFIILSISAGPGRYLLWGGGGGVFLLLSSLSFPLSSVFLLYFLVYLGSYLHMYIFIMGTPPL